MPKYLIVIIVFSFFSRLAFANKVDDLKTDKDVAAFFIANIPSKLKWYEGKPFIKSNDSLSYLFKHCGGVDESAKIKNWIKLDANDDGLTDLLVLVSGIERHSQSLKNVQYLIIDKANKHFTFTRIDRGNRFEGCTYATVINTDKQTGLLFHYMKALPLPKDKPLYDQQEIFQKDTLIYKFGTLLEYNPKPDNPVIDSVTFETSRCFGKCPVFKIQISKNGDANYRADKYNKVSGDFKTNVSAKQLKQVFEVLNYIDLKALDNEYAVNWTDDQHCWLIIKFTDGSVKKVHDYGMIGTFALRRLYVLLSDMRDNQNWLPVD